MTWSVDWPHSREVVARDFRNENDDGTITLRHVKCGPAADAAPKPASDHMRIVTHSSRATATKIPVISAPMIFAIAVPSSGVSH